MIHIYIFIKKSSYSKNKNKIMITEINTINDVKTFTKHLINVEKLSFHPDDDFTDYIDCNTNKPFYTKEEAEKRNQLMNTCFDVCEKNKKEIYTVMLPFFLKSLKIA